MKYLSKVYCIIITLALLLYNVIISHFCHPPSPKKFHSYPFQTHNQNPFFCYARKLILHWHKPFILLFIITLDLYKEMDKGTNQQYIIIKQTPKRRYLLMSLAKLEICMTKISNVLSLTCINPTTNPKLLFVKNTESQLQLLPLISNNIQPLKRMMAKFLLKNKSKNFKNVTLNLQKNL